MTTNRRQMNDKSGDVTDKMGGRDQGRSTGRDLFDGRWQDMRDAVREHFDELTDDDIAMVDRDNSSFMNVLRKRYDYDQSSAQQEWNAFLQEYEGDGGDDGDKSDMANTDTDGQTGAMSRSSQSRVADMSSAPQERGLAQPSRQSMGPGSMSGSKKGNSRL